MEIGRLTRPIPHGRDGTLATAHAGQAGVPHQPGDTFATDTNSGIRKLNLKTRRSIRAFSRPRAPRGFPRATRRPSRHAHRAARFTQVVIAAGGDIQYAAHHSNCVHEAGATSRCGDLVYRFTNPPEVTFTVPALTIVIGPDTVCGDAGTAAPGSGAGHGKNRRYSGSCHRRLLRSSTERI